MIPPALRQAGSVGETVVGISWWQPLNSRHQSLKRAGSARVGEKPIDENAKESCTDRGLETFPLAEKGLERWDCRRVFRAASGLKKTMRARP